MPSGDDLVDDYIPDSDLVIDSEAEEASGSGEEGYEEFPGLQADVASSTSEQADVSRTRKRKRKEKEKEKKAKKRKLVATQDLIEPPSVASQTPAEIQFYLSTQQAKAFPKLSILELEEIRIPDACVADTTSYSGDRTLDHLGDFMAESLPQLMTRLGQKPRSNGAPTLIFVAGAALRVADVTRVLRKYRGDKGGEVAKLFARHFKLEEHITYLKRTKIGVAVGTPARLGQLLGKGALTLTALTHIIVDITHQDAKKRTMMDIPETRDGLFRGVLSDDNVRAAFRTGKLKLVLL